MHAPDRTGLPRRTRLVHPHRHIRPGRGSQRDLPVDPGGLAPSVALRHLPHADQRVRPAPQHQSLQAPDLRPVLLLRRLEDPLPQPPYVLLTGTPVNGGPYQPVLGSVHRHRRLTRPSVPAVRPPAFNGSPAHVSALSRPGTRPGIRPVIRDHPAEEPVTHASLSCCLSATGIGFLGILSRQGIRPPLRSAYRNSVPDPDGVSMFRTREMRLGPGALCTPGTTVPARPRVNPVTAACRLATAGPCHPGPTTRPGMLLSRGISKSSLAFTPSQPSPRL